MSYEEFLALAEKPSDKTSPMGGVNSQFALFFGGSELLEHLEDFGSFDDLTDDIGIEESWPADFPKVFPNLKPIAVAIEDDDQDSYSEFLLLVDISKDARPVYWMSAESFDWDEFEESKMGFEDLADSFEEFYASLVDY